MPSADRMPFERESGEWLIVPRSICGDSDDRRPDVSGPGLRASRPQRIGRAGVWIAGNKHGPAQGPGSRWKFLEAGGAARPALIEAGLPTGRDAGSGLPRIAAAGNRRLGPGRRKGAGIGSLHRGPLRPPHMEAPAATPLQGAMAGWDRLDRDGWL